MSRVLDNCLNNLTILVVGSKGDEKLLLESIFLEFGAEAIVFVSVTEAITVLKQLQPDILIGELIMPDEDGYTFIRKVRNLPTPFSQIPALAYSVAAGQREHFEALLAGFDAHLSKPTSIYVLVAMIKSLIKIKKFPKLESYVSLQQDSKINQCV